MELSTQITVRFPLRVWFTRGALAPGNRVLARALASPSADAPGRVLAVVDGGLVQAQPGLPGQIAAWFAARPDRGMLADKPRVLPGGERAKGSLEQVLRIHRWADAAGLDRHSFLLAIGGGAVLDVAGLAAATFHRGLRLVRMPSTTLSQADSGLGVKNGVNALGKKNLLGTFAPPWAVVNDRALLASLPARDLRAGCAEAVKVALVKDARFFRALERRAPALARLELPAVEWLVARSARLHLDHLAGGGDPFESGTARPLDYGHWAAHKLESLSRHRWRHGEAVAAGMALDTLYAVRLGMLPERDGERVLRLLEQLGFALWLPAMGARDARGRWRLLEGLEEFREHLGGRLSIPLLTGLGRVTQVGEVNPQAVLDAMEALRRR